MRPAPHLQTQGKQSPLSPTKAGGVRPQNGSVSPVPHSAPRHTFGCASPALQQCEPLCQLCAPLRRLSLFSILARCRAKIAMTLGARQVHLKIVALGGTLGPATQ